MGSISPIEARGPIVASDFKSLIEIYLSPQAVEIVFGVPRFGTSGRSLARINLASCHQLLTCSGPSQCC